MPHLRTEAAGLPGVSSPAGAGLRHFRLDGRLNWYQGGIYTCRATRVGMGLAQQSFGAGLEHSPAALFDLCLPG